MFATSGARVLFLSLLAISPAIVAQGIPAGGGTSTATRPGSVQDSGPTGYWTEMDSQGRAGGALIGKIAMENGISFWEPVIVSVTCKNEVVYTTATDAKGNFAVFAPSQPGAPLSSQADNKRRMEKLYENCGVSATLPGFTSNTLVITHRMLRDDPNIGTLTLHAVEKSAASSRSDDAAGTAISSMRASAPASAIKAFDKAHSELMQHNSDQAQKELEKAIQIYPQFADAWYQLGRLQVAKNSHDAETSFAKALDADPQFVPPYDALATLAAQQGNWKEVARYTSRVGKLDPVGNAQIWYWDALANYQLNHVSVAATSAAKSLAMDPLHTVPNTEQLLAVALANEKDYAGAVKHLRNLLTYLPSGSNADLVKQQIVTLENQMGKPSGQ